MISVAANCQTKEWNLRSDKPTGHLSNCPWHSVGWKWWERWQSSGRGIFASFVARRKEKIRAESVSLLWLGDIRHENSTWGWNLQTHYQGTSVKRSRILWGWVLVLSLIFLRKLQKSCHDSSWLATQLPECTQTFQEDVPVTGLESESTRSLFSTRLKMTRLKVTR